MRIAGIAHPNPPPVNIAVKNRIAGKNSMCRVRGRNIAIPIDIDKPGIVPNISPINIPGGTTAQASVSSDNKAMASWNAGPSIIC